MRGTRFIAVCCAVALLPLTACQSVPDAAAAVAGLPSSPSVVCDRSTLDEQAGQAVELGYKLFRTSVELLTDVGYIKGARATKLASIDNQAFAATQAVQSAYKTCNATSYKVAIDQAKAVLAQANAALAAK
jgi:hypothetical protein